MPHVVVPTVRNARKGLNASMASAYRTSVKGLGVHAPATASARRTTSAKMVRASCAHPVNVTNQQDARLPDVILEKSVTRLQANVSPQVQREHAKHVRRMLIVEKAAGAVSLWVAVRSVLLPAEALTTVPLAGHAGVERAHRQASSASAAVSMDAPMVKSVTQAPDSARRRSLNATRASTTGNAVLAVHVTASAQG